MFNFNLLRLYSNTVVTYCTPRRKFPSHCSIIMSSATSNFESDERFRNKHVIITGAGGNFGREGVIYFTLRGAKVSALDNNQQTLKETIDEVTKILTSAGKLSGTNINDIVLTYECDVTKPSIVEEVISKVTNCFGTPELLWNNAGYQGQIKPTLDYDPQDFALVMNINVTGMFTVLQAVAKKMAAASKETTIVDGGIQEESNSYKPGKGGFAIVNTASVAGLRGTPAMVAYSSSKAAVLAMTVSTGKDLAPYGIRVNAISPALIGPGFMWERQNELHAISGSPYFSKDAETVATNKINSVPMKRLGSIAEVVKSVAFLLSEESSYTTCFNLVVDGGMSGGLH